MNAAGKTQVSHQDQIRKIFGGKAITKLTVAELETAIPQIEGLVAQAKSQLDEVEAQVEGKAAEMLGTEGGLDKLRSLSEQLIPLRTTYDALQLALRGACNAREAAIARAKREAVETARAAIEEILAQRQACAERIAAHLDEIADDFGQMLSLWREAAKSADQKLVTAFGHGFKMQGNTSGGGRPETLQREIEIHIGQRARGWITRDLPFGVRSFSQMSSAWHLQMLGDFEQRFDTLQSGT